jgi:hypothetical protein
MALQTQDKKNGQLGDIAQAGVIAGGSRALDSDAAPSQVPTDSTPVANVAAQAPSIAQPSYFGGRSPQEIQTLQTAQNKDFGNEVSRFGDNVVNVLGGLSPRGQTPAEAADTNNVLQIQSQNDQAFRNRAAQHQAEIASQYGGTPTVVNPNAPTISAPSTPLIPAQTGTPLLSAQNTAQASSGIVDIGKTLVPSIAGAAANNEPVDLSRIPGQKDSHPKLQGGDGVVETTNAQGHRSFSADGSTSADIKTPSTGAFAATNSDGKTTFQTVPSSSFTGQNTGGPSIAKSDRVETYTGVDGKIHQLGSDGGGDRGVTIGSNVQAAQGPGGTQDDQRKLLDGIYQQAQKLDALGFHQKAGALLQGSSSLINGSVDPASIEANRNKTIGDTDNASKKAGLEAADQALKDYEAHVRGTTASIAQQGGQRANQDNLLQAESEKAYAANPDDPKVAAAYRAYHGKSPEKYQSQSVILGQKQDGLGGSTPIVGNQLVDTATGKPLAQQASNQQQSAAPPNGKEGETHEDAAGNQITFKNGKWVQTKASGAK